MKKENSEIMFEFPLVRKGRLWYNIRNDIPYIIEVKAMNDKIVIRGARENNLKNVDVTIPRDKLVVFTGLSGSGKSSLAFDTIFAEGQRRYVES